MEKLIVSMTVLLYGFKTGYAVPVSPKHQQGGTAYLPPLPESALDQNNLLRSSQFNTIHTLKNANSYTTSYKTNHNAFEADPQIKSESSYSRTYHNSYSPQPSGIGNNILLPPTPAPLPSLQPNTVLKQLTSTSSTTFPSLSSINNSILDSTPVDNSVIFPSIVMVDHSMEVLTPSQNQTIFAAKFLASSLLQEALDSSSSTADGFINIEPNDMKKLNSKDMFIVKAQKNAYIVPNNLNKMEIQDLYNMRSKLEKAFTINQFVFIVKPENINFLNKLV